MAQHQPAGLVEDLGDFCARLLPLLQVVYDFSWGKPTWIGLNDLEEEGRWGWADGSAPIYTNWLPGEPKDMGLKYGEDCVAMGRAAGGRIGSHRQGGARGPSWLCLLASNSVLRVTR